MQRLGHDNRHDRRSKMRSAHKSMLLFNSPNITEVCWRAGERQATTKPFNVKETFKSGSMTSNLCVIRAKDDHGRWHHSYAETTNFSPREIGPGS